MLMLAGLLALVTFLGKIDLSGESTPKEFTLENVKPTGKIIESSFTWKYVDNEMNKWEPTLRLQIREDDVREALRLMKKIEDDLSRSEFIRGSGSGRKLPEDVARAVWSRIYHIVYRKSIPHLEKINADLRRLFEKEEMGVEDRFLFLSSFVQNIKYKVPDTEFGFNPPAVTLATKYGDCDTKAILLYILLQKQGIGCVLLWSGEYAHAMLGVRVSASGEYKMYRGEKYYFMETTYPNWSAGQLPPEVGDPDYWYVDDLDDVPVPMP